MGLVWVEIEEIVVFEFAWIHTYRSCMYNIIGGEIYDNMIVVDFCTSKKLPSDLQYLHKYMCVYFLILYILWQLESWRVQSRAFSI